MADDDEQSDIASDIDEGDEIVLPESDSDEEDSDTEDNLTKLTIKKTVPYVPKKDRITSNVMNHYEVTLVVSTRAQQIENGHETYVERRPGDSIRDLAIRELIEARKKIPYTLERRVGTLRESWALDELSLPNLDVLHII